MRVEGKQNGLYLPKVLAVAFCNYLYSSIKLKKKKKKYLYSSIRLSSNKKKPI